MCSVISDIWIWPRREDHHGIRCILLHASLTSLNCIRTSALILRWRRSVYLLGSALTFFWPLVMWTIITLFYCTVYFRSEYKYICIYIFIQNGFDIFEMISNKTYFVKLFLRLSVPVLLCIIIIIHWAILAQPTFLLFLFQISRFFSVASPGYQFLQRSHPIHFYCLARLFLLG